MKTMTAFIFIFMGISFGQTHQDSLVELSLKTKSLQHTVDSLSQEFEKYAIAKDFFSSQMTALTAIFLFIGAGIILFAGFISFRGVQRKFNNDMEKARTKFEKETNELEIRINNLNETIESATTKIEDSVNLANAKSDLNSLILLLHPDKKEPTSALLTLRLAFYFFDEGDEKVALDFLNRCWDSIESCEMLPVVKSALMNTLKSFDGERIQNTNIKAVIDRIKNKIEL